MQPLTVLTGETSLHGPSEPSPATLRFLRTESVRDQILGGLGSKMVTLNPLTMKYPRYGAKSSISVNEVMDPLLKDIALESSILLARGMHGYLGLG